MLGSIPCRFELTSTIICFMRPILLECEAARASSCGETTLFRFVLADTERGSSEEVGSV